jgi:dTDP-glucose 4,6-dehydratase
LWASDLKDIKHGLSDDLNELLSVNPSPWEKLSRANIFLTGASGLFGRWMLESLLWAVDKLGLETTVTVLIRNPVDWLRVVPHLARHGSVTIVGGDLLNFNFPSSPFTHLVHLAAPSGKVQQTDPLYTFDLILKGTRRILDLAVASGAKRFLLVSSGAVYGRHHNQPEPISESCCEAPNPLSGGPSAYDEGKRAAELLCSIYFHQYQLTTVVARCFSFIGPFLPLNEHFAAGNFIRDALDGGPITVNGDGTPIRTYLYLADLAWWLWTILVDGKPAQAYNVGGDEPVSTGDLAQLTANCFSPPIKVIISTKAKVGLKLQCQVPDVNRAKQELGLFPRLNLKESLRRTLSWYAK